MIKREYNMKKITTKKNTDKHITNPFIDSLESSFRTSYKPVKRSDEYIDGATGEVFTNCKLSQPKLSDRSPYLRVYDNTINLLLVLSHPAIRLAALIMKDAKQDTDQVYLSFSSDVSALMSPSSFYSAKSELIDYGMIAPSDNPNIYWLNPMMFYNGSREKLVAKNRKAVDVSHYYDINSVQNIGLSVQIGGAVS